MSADAPPPLSELPPHVLTTTVLPAHIPQLHSLYVHEASATTFPSSKSLPSLHSLLSHALLTLLAVSPSSTRVLGFLVVTGDPLDPLLEDVIVHPQHRGRGLGALLVQRALAWAWERRAVRMELYCRWEVRGFYEQLGFQLVRGEARQRCLMRCLQPSPAG